MPSPRAADHRLQMSCAALAVIAASALAACGTAGATSPSHSSSAGLARLPRVSAAPATAAAIDRYAAIARHRYDKEVSGAAIHTQLRRLARDPALLRTLRSGDTAALRRYVQRQFRAVWYHWHVSRLRIVRGGRVIDEVGVPFTLAGQQTTLRGAGGRALATLQITVQDEVGILKAMLRHYPVEVVIRGRGSAHRLSSLPAAKTAALPASGFVQIAGRRYLVRSFRRLAFVNEPVTIWILTRA